MRCGFGSDAKRGLRAERGSVAVEFAIVLPLLLFLILGGIDIGHRYYIQYLTSNASREGARYAAKYTGTTVDPTSDQISNYVKLSSGLDYDSRNLDTLLVSGSYTGVSPNRTVTVTVTAIKHWWVLGSVNLFTHFGFHGFTNPQTITATTAMLVER